ncbi:DEAD/DEAH box helicase family protein [Streptomyces sp. RKAG337]|uniref:DEAD/DEAH box helicase family protein n=1 Tax=Streptomyces sp. RKAG337 TaxID=2893404 RepID=UPI002033DC6B|nr:DEAD/DEAH box helicase family protein [Streptomyces sp. RKAG337]MCM2430979.1 DEAD/DEAH box helicase family protein [Streptomyces sp. RKAG337]
MTATVAAPHRMRLRPHQARAVHCATTALRHGTRTTVVSACGTGKTAIAARVAQKVVRRGHQLVLLPTLELLAQTIAEWREAGHTGPVMAMCYRRPVVPGERVPASTHPGYLAAWIQDNPNGTVFALYQSLNKIHKAHRDYKLGPWALISVDEAHRTSGYIGKEWAAVHDDELIPAGRRAYYTATPGSGRLAMARTPLSSRPWRTPSSTARPRFASRWPKPSTWSSWPTTASSSWKSTRPNCAPAWACPTGPPKQNCAPQPSRSPCCAP